MGLCSCADCVVVVYREVCCSLRPCCLLKRSFVKSSSVLVSSFVGATTLDVAAVEEEVDNDE